MVARYRPLKIKAKPRGRSFKKGMTKPPGSGRVKGQRNRLTLNVKTALEESAADIGELVPVWSSYKKDGRTPALGAHVICWRPTGKDGLRGYFRSLAVMNPSAYTSLWAKILPSQINLTAQSNMTVTSRFSAADLSKMTMAEKIAAYREAVGLTKELPPEQKLIDVTPLPTVAEETSEDPGMSSEDANKAAA